MASQLHNLAVKLTDLLLDGIGNLRPRPSANRGIACNPPLRKTDVDTPISQQTMRNAG
jgi:hypothetical protein